MQPTHATGTCLPPQQLEAYARGRLQGESAIACEEHLLVCATCQHCLAELFEAGNRPDWLQPKAAGLYDPTRVSRTDASTLRSSHDGSLNDPSPRKMPAAHRVWHRQALSDPHLSPSPNWAAETLPASIGRYKIVARLGSGGFGSVFLARDQKLQRNVALKVPHQPQSHPQLHWDLLLAEAQTVAALDHPAIVPIYDVSATDSVPLFLVTKLIEGSTLAEQLSRNRYTPVEAAQLIVCVADALHYAHERGIIHRDIKPQNILLDHAGQVYLTDFGLAWRVAEHTRAHPNAGTPFYMSPEQLSGDSTAIDERSDVYCLARVLQQMLGGFEYLQVQDGAAARLVSAVAPTRDTLSPTADSNQPNAVLQGSVPAELRNICAKATAANPELRYQSAAEFALELRRFIQSQTPFLKRHRRALVSIVCAVTVCIVISGASLYSIANNAARVAINQAVEALLLSDPGTFQQRALATELSTPHAQSMLRSMAQSSDHAKSMRARLGLLSADPSLVAAVSEDMLNSPPEISRALIPFLTPHAAQLVPGFWQTFQDDPQRSRRLNAAAYLAYAAEHDVHWKDENVVFQLLKDLVGDPIADRKHRIKSLTSQRPLLIKGMNRALQTKTFHIAPQDRLDFNSIWEMLAEDDLSTSIDLMVSGPPHTFTSILDRLDPKDPETIRLLRAKVNGVPSTESEAPTHQQRHMAALALLKLGHEQCYWPLWRSQNDQSHITVQTSIVGYEPLTRERIVAHLRNTGALSPVKSLPREFTERLGRADLSERRNLLLALSATQFRDPTAHIAAMTEPRFIGELQSLYLEDADACVHGLAKQLLAQANASLPKLDPSAQSVDRNDSWFSNSLGNILVIIPPNPSVSYRFAISNCEVERQHFELFLQDTQHAWTGVRLAQEHETPLNDPTTAQGGMSWYDAAAFCNWLSRREGLEECYEPNEEGNYSEGMKIRANALQLDGYRLPTDTEWECAGRAGVVTPLFFGDSLFAMQDYLWLLSSSRGRIMPVGQLRPNNFGLFDIHGNVSEWTMPTSPQPDAAMVIRNEREIHHRGANVLSNGVTAVYFGSRESLRPDQRSFPTGLRIVRTLR